MIIETVLPYAVGLLGGVVLGIFCSGGLLLTVRKIPASRNPRLLLLVSTVLRLGTTFLVLFLVGRKHPLLFLVMLPGFFGCRFIMTRRAAHGERRTIHAA